MIHVSAGSLSSSVKEQEKGTLALNPVLAIETGQVCFDGNNMAFNSMIK